ncbi:MAG: serine hydrolase [Chloroflexia bacterium]
MTDTPSLPRSTPEAQGVSSVAIRTFIEVAEREFDALHSFMLVRHGNVVAEGWWEPYHPSDRHLLFSVSKSFTSTAIGMLVAEGKLSIDDPVLSFFPNKSPYSPGANLRAMRVRHLLSMSTGHAVDTTEPMATQPGKTWVEGFLVQPVEHKPGTHFLYNTGATYMLSAIVQKLTGRRMIDYLRPRLFEPLGIADPQWEVSPQGIDVGGWGLSITTADIAAFGHLYLQKGMWQGKRILPEAWVVEATSLHTPNAPALNIDWEQGYGYQFWMCRHNAYRGDGAFGQYCVVMPEQDAVLAITGGLFDMQPPLDLLWNLLLPVMGSAPLPDNAEAQTALANKLSNLKLSTPKGEKLSATAERISGKTFIIERNRDGIEEVTFDYSTGEAVVTLVTEDGEQSFACGFGEWKRGSAILEPTMHPHLASPKRSEPWHISAAGAWTDEQTYTSRLAFYKTPFVRTFVAHFAGDSLTIEQRVNVGFGPTEGARLKGKLKSV